MLWTEFITSATDLLSCNASLKRGLDPPRNVSENLNSLILFVVDSTLGVGVKNKRWIDSAFVLS